MDLNVVGVMLDAPGPRLESIGLAGRRRHLGLVLVRVVLSLQSLRLVSEEDLMHFGLPSELPLTGLPLGLLRLLVGLNIFRFMTGNFHLAMFGLNHVQINPLLLE